MSDVGDDRAELLDDDLQDTGDDELRPDRNLRDDDVGGDVGPLVELDEGGGPDDTAEAVAIEIDDRGDATLGDIATERDDVESAEEAAMHLTSDPPMDDDDGYLS